MQSDKKDSSGVYFCPYCHNTRMIEKNDLYAYHECNRCKSDMIFAISKDDFITNNEDERKTFVSNLKSKYPKLLLLQRFYLKNSMTTIK